MKDRTYLGELELMILLTLVGLGEGAYGVPIARELEPHRRVTLGSVYATLERLEKKRLVSSTLGEATPERGGRAKRYFRVTKQGLLELRETRRVLIELWRKLPEVKGEAL